MKRETYRQVLRLAVPALGALAAEPMFVMVDSAIVGHLGVAPLAGLALAGMVINTCVYLCVFLAYATTAGVARAYGAGKLADAARQGIDSLWLGLGLGLAVAGGLFAAAKPICAALGAKGPVLDAAVAYLRWSAPGLPAMLAVLAATGVLRGLQNTRITFHVAVVGGAVDAVLSFVLCYPAGMGIRGSALATVVAQVIMALWAGGLVVVLARRQGVSLLPHPQGVWEAVRAGTPLFIRTCCLRAAGLTTLWAAAALGAAQLAAHQVAMNVWSFSALSVDALAIAAQALVGASLGARDQAGPEESQPASNLAEIKRVVIRLSVLTGAGIGVFFAAISPVLPWAFTSSAEVRSAATWALLALAVCMPLGAWAFALDGILMGAGTEGAFLAKGMFAALICYLPVVVAIRLMAHGTLGLALLWIGYAGVFMVIRAAIYRRRVARV